MSQHRRFHNSNNHHHVTTTGILSQQQQPQHPPSPSSSGAAPAMYDTSLSSNAAAGGADSLSSTWSSRSGSGNNHATITASAATTANSSHYNYFPKSHPGNSNHDMLQKSPKQSSSRSPFSTSSTISQYSLSGYHSASQQEQEQQFRSLSHNVATTPTKKTADQRSWTSAPVNSPSMAAAASKFANRQQQQSTSSYSTTPTTRSGSSSARRLKNTTSSASENLPQHLQSPSHSGKNNNDPTPAVTTNGSSSYRPSYQNLNHHSSDQHRALSEPILTEQDRFAAYVNRFAQVDPRATFSKSLNSPSSKHPPPRGQQQSPPSQGSTTTTDSKLPPRGSGGITSNRGSPSLSPFSHTRKYFHPNSKSPSSSSSYQRQTSGESSASATASSTSATLASSSIFKRKLAAPVNHRGSPSCVVTEPQAWNEDSISSSAAGVTQVSGTGNIELEARGDGSDNNPTVTELRRTSSDMGRTTSSTATRRTRPSASRYRAGTGASTTSSLSQASDPTSEYEEDQPELLERGGVRPTSTQRLSPPPPTIVESAGSNPSQSSSRSKPQPLTFTTAAPTLRRDAPEQNQAAVLDDRYTSVYDAKEEEYHDLDNNVDYQLSHPSIPHEQPPRNEGNGGRRSSSLPPTKLLTESSNVHTDNNNGGSSTSRGRSPVATVSPAEQPKRFSSMDAVARDKSYRRLMITKMTDHASSTKDSLPPSSLGQSRTPTRSNSPQPPLSGRSWSPSSRPTTTMSDVGVGVGGIITSQRVVEDSTPSPGTNRTRDLAKRFEQRMQSKGRSSQLLKSAMHSAYQQQQQQKMTMAKQQQGTSSFPQSHSNDSGEADEKKETEELLAYHAAVGNLDHPLPSRIKELKEKLWDDNEYLQVRVRPTLPYQGEDERSPQNQYSDHQTHHYNPDEHDLLRSPRYGPVGRGRPGTDAFSTASSPSSAQYQGQTSLHHPYRQTRSLSPRTSRKPYDAANHLLVQPKLNHGPNPTKPSERAVTTTQSDVASSAGSAGSGGHRFKSKFYEAAALSSPEWSHQGGGTGGNTSRSEGNSEEKPLGANPVQPVSPYHLHPAHKSTWMKNKAKAASEADAPYSQASTPKITNEHNVSLLLRKLHSINRQNPTQALAEIDEILKAEALKDDPTLQKALRVTEEEYMSTLKAQQTKTDCPQNDDESDSETTVSSITNPTYQGHPSKKPDGNESVLDGTTPEADGNDLNALQTSSPSQKNGRAFNPTSGDKECERASRTPSSSRPPLPPPPDTISGKERQSDRVGQRQNDEQQQHTQEQHAGKHSQQGHGYEGQVPRVEGIRFDDLYKSNSEDLALKIRRWDELSANKQVNGGTTATEDLVSNATEELGSIVTPMDQQNQLLVSPRPHQAWEASPLALLDTSMQSAEDADILDASPPVPVKQERPARRLSPVNNEKMMNLANDFDDAWVALPTSRFFQSTSPERRESSSSQQQKTPHSNKSRSQSRNSGAPRRPSEQSESEPPPTRNTVSHETKSTGAYDQERIDKSQYEPEYQGEPAVEEWAGNGEISNTKPKRRLRALLQRGRINDKSGQTSASVTTSSIAGTSKRSTGQSEDEEALTSPRNHSSHRSSMKDNQHRGRSGNTRSEANRSRSLEERRVRNPNIARKFSRMLRVYGEEEKAFV